MLDLHMACGRSFTLFIDEAFILEIRTLLKKAHDSGLKALPEDQSKQILASYAVPVIKEVTADSKDQAVKEAEKMGFPVVLKGLGHKLLHKTELDLVHLNLSDSTMVEKAANRITENAGKDLEGFLVQPQVRGNREFVAGLFRDPQFGPVILFGIGGILTETISDISLKPAPITPKDAEDMIDRIKAADLLGAFRGEQPVDRKSLVKTLLGLSRIGMDHPLISEIDINPLIADASGKLHAVDALINLKTPEKPDTTLPHAPPEAIGALFYPKSVAFIGASSQLGKWGHMLLSNTISGGYKGDVYFVNPKSDTIAGRKVYPSVVEVPGPVDLAVVTIPAAAVLGLIPQFKEKGIRYMLLITSGFGETGGDGKKLEKELVQQAMDSGILILGPNTMGICNPHIDFFCTGTSVNPIAGSTAVVAQSGNMGTQLLAFAEKQGIGIRAFSGSGNEAMITIEDYLDGFEVDPLTRIVMLYIESVKNGRRFFESALRVGKTKPIVLLKGGQTKAGNKAALSHTGAMASDSKVFNAVCEQAGIIKVEHPMDLLDLAAAFSSLPLPKGNRAAIMTLGGGWGVVTADLCAGLGLEIPVLSDSIIKTIDKLLPPYWSRSNPIDLVGENDLSIPLTVLEALLKWDGCDGVINLGILGRRIFIRRLVDSIEKSDPSYSKEFLDAAVDTLTDFEEKYIDHITALMETYQKPVYGVGLLTDETDYTVYRIKDRQYKGVFYETPERAVKAFSKMYEYYKFQNL